MAVIEDQGGWWGGLTGNLTPSLTSCLPPTDTLCCFQLFLETWHFWQKVKMRFFSKQEKQNTFILFYWYSAQPHSSQVKTVQWYTENPTVRRQRGCDDDTNTNEHGATAESEFSSRWSTLLPLSLQSTSALSFHLHSVVELKQSGGSRGHWGDGTLNLTGVSCRVSCSVHHRDVSWGRKREQSARFGCGLSSRALQHVNTFNWSQTSPQSLSNKLIGV